MKIITKTELEELHLRMKKGRTLFLINAIKELKIGQILFISIEEWEETGLKSTPTQTIINAVRHPRGALSGQKISIKSALEGWIIEKYE
jgi:hypothetical protein